MNSKHIAQLRHKITFLENDSLSEINSSKWHKIIEVFAEIKPVCDSKFISLHGLQFGNIITAEYYTFKIRFTSKINKEMRINFNNRIFEIQRVLNTDERNKMLIIIALGI